MFVFGWVVGVDDDVVDDDVVDDSEDDIICFNVIQPMSSSSSNGNDSGACGGVPESSNIPCGFPVPGRVMG